MPVETSDSEELHAKNKNSGSSSPLKTNKKCEICEITEVEAFEEEEPCT